MSALLNPSGGAMRNGIDAGLDTPFDFPSYFALRDVFVCDAPLTRLADVLREDALYPHPERLVPFLGNHDTKRFLSESGATTTRLKMAFAVLATMRGMPQIDSGDEIASVGGEDPDNRQDFPGGFPGDLPSLFSTTDRSDEQRKMHDWVAMLLHVRESHVALQTGGEQLILAKTGVMAYVRGENLSSGCAGGEQAGSRILVVVNNEDHAETLMLPTQDTSLAGCGKALSLLGSGGLLKVKGDVDEITLQPRRVEVLLLTQ